MRAFPGRRKFIAVLGGGIVLAATGGGLWAASRDPTRARIPWETAGEDPDPRRRALSFAILAPNPHNRQAWMADLGSPEAITIFCDLERRLPHTDPFDRQTVIGLGCFLELLVQAAAQDGYRAEVALFPEGEPQPTLDERPVAHIRLVEDAQVARDPLFAHVLARRSNKEAYDVGRTVDPALLAQVARESRSSSIAHTSDLQRIDALRGQAWQAMLVELTTPETAKESIDLLRIGRAEIEANPDGIDLPGAWPEALSLVGLLSKETMLDPESTTFKQQLPILKKPFDTAMAFLWQTTPGNTRINQIAAGRDYVRLNLAATGHGLAMHPLSQALQEYPEMRPYHQAIRTALGVDASETLQMFVRLGYGPDAKARPRWPHDTRVLEVPGQS